MEELLKSKLLELGLSKKQIDKLEAEGVTTEVDLAKLTDAEIKGITGCGLVVAKKIVEFSAAQAGTETALSLAGERAVVEILPALPADDQSSLEMLKTGGIVKGEAIVVLAAVRAHIAHQVGIEKIPAILLAKVEAFAESQDEPVPTKIFSALQKIISTRAYAEVLNACGITGPFMNEARKKKFLAKLDSGFWNSIADFQAKLDEWWDLWTGEMKSMGVAMLAYKDDKSGRGDEFSEMIEPPDVRSLRAAAEVVYNQINRVMAGVGIPVARALAYDNTKTREVLLLEGLPEAIGCTSVEQMLKVIGSELGTTIEADIVDFELNVTNYMLAIMHLKDVPSDKERRYLVGLRKLGKVIDWERLGCTGGASSGSAPFRAR